MNDKASYFSTRIYILKYISIYTIVINKTQKNMNMYTKKHTPFPHIYAYTVSYISALLKCIFMPTIHLIKNKCIDSYLNGLFVDTEPS